MTKRGKEPKKRKKLDPIEVGSGITKYIRLPSIIDPPYREKAQKGALVDSRIPISPAEKLENFRREVEQFCKEVFKEKGLPDPFSFIHREGKFTPLKGHVVMAKGDEYLKSRSDLGYRLSAEIHTPSEDHSRHWYAARLAIGFTKLDLLVAKSEAFSGPAPVLIMSAAQIGIELGGLDKERRFKPAHEPDAIRGKDTISAASKGGLTRASATRNQYGAAFSEMDRRIDAGESTAHAARQVVKKNQFGVTIKASSLVKAYSRHLASKK